MFVYFNPNPQNKAVGDCTVRALAKLLDVSWHKAYDALCDEGYLDGDMPSSNAVMGALLRKMGFRRRIVSNLCPTCYTLRDFARDHPEGECLVAFGNHVVTVVDGDYYDSWDSGSENPLYYYTKEDDE